MFDRHLVRVFEVLVCEDGNNVVFSCSRQHAASAFALTERIIIGHVGSQCESLLVRFGRLLGLEIVLVLGLLLDILDEVIDILVLCVFPVVHAHVVLGGAGGVRQQVVGLAVAFS